MYKKRQSKIEKRSSKETLTIFPEICHSYIFINNEEILSKYLRIETDLSGSKSHAKCELSDMMRKMESLVNSNSNGYLWQTCENMKNNLSFLQKELLVENEPIKSLLETQIYNSNLTIKFNIDASILSSSHNCNI